MLNKVQLIGFLGADPELRRSNDSDAIAVAIPQESKILIIREVPQ